MKIPAVFNHSSQEATFVNPLEIENTAPYELDKIKFRAWCSKPDTRHVFLCSFEGINPVLRVSPDNPPSRMHAFFADYDSPYPDDMAERLKAVPKLRYRPTYACRTHSGNIRLMWMFEESVQVPSDMAADVSRQMANTLSASQLFPVYDATCEAPHQHFELGVGWEECGPKLPRAVVEGVVFKAMTARKPVYDLIPLEIVGKEVARRFPNRWSKPFELGARGPLFWIDDGVDREGAVVCEDGMMCFSDRAGSAFLTWKEILGNNFVRDYEDRKLSEVGANVYYDGKRYYEVDDRGRVFSITKEDFVLRLRQAGLNPRCRKKDKLSEVEQAVLWVQEMHRVHTVAPVLHDHNRIVEVNNCVILNNNLAKPVAPAESGDPERWPWLFSFYQGYFEHHDGLNPLDYYFAWLQRAYFAMLHGRLLSGQAAIFVGPTGRGKTLNSNVIVGGLLGGAIDAAQFLQSKEKFNRELAENPVWAIDDATAPPSGHELRQFTETIKRYVANPYISVRAMYTDPQRVPFGGRILITLNPDPNSLGLIPALDQSNRDKLMAFKLRDDTIPQFLPNHLQEERIREELPYFAKWLLEWVPPRETIGEARFGVKCIYHPDIIDAARDNSSRSAALETIELFARHIRGLDPKMEVWRGTTTDLMSLFGELEPLRGLTIGRNHYQLQTGLNQAEEAFNADPDNNRPVTSKTSGRGKQWTIDLSAKYDDHQHQPTAA